MMAKSYELEQLIAQLIKDCDDLEDGSIVGTIDSRTYQIKKYLATHHTSIVRGW